MALQLIVTRPAAQAVDWIRQFSALGLAAHALPLIRIEPAADPAPLIAAWQRLSSYRLVMFVSSNAVDHFFAAGVGVAVWPGEVRAGATGPGTSSALRRAGVPPPLLVEPDADSGQFDSEALWAQLQAMPWAGRRALVVRGEGGRDWLADVLREHGAHVDFVVAYRRVAPQLDPAGQHLLAAALRGPAAHLWLFSSSEAVANLRTLVPDADWSRSLALASHPRVAQAARGLGFGDVRVAAPSVQAVVHCVAGLASTGW